MPSNQSKYTHSFDACVTKSQTLMKNRDTEHFFFIVQRFILFDFRFKILLVVLLSLIRCSVILNVLSRSWSNFVHAEEIDKARGKEKERTRDCCRNQCLKGTQNHQSYAITMKIIYMTENCAMNSSAVNFPMFLCARSQNPSTQTALILNFKIHLW